MNGENEACGRCGHDVDTHFLDRERKGEHPEGVDARSFRGACLAFRCDSCKRYVAPGKPTARALRAAKKSS